ncbi:hypothetical protein GCM10009129_16540 [Psychrobacter aestuarii]|uniref:Uncharacterized protein n=1 Tax=Psychrobacter aestuarii TaxID=556327 RepID=A0ABN0VX90_9GAMM
MFNTLYHDNDVHIYTHHSFEVKSKQDENLDFFVAYQGNHYACTAFSLDSVIALNADTSIDVFNNYFWAPYTIIIKQFSSACLIKAVLEIISDNTISFEKVFCLQD